MVSCGFPLPVGRLGWLASGKVDSIRKTSDEPLLVSPRIGEVAHQRAVGIAVLGSFARVFAGVSVCRVEWGAGITLPSLIKPCMQFSRTRLSDVLHDKACALVQPAVVGTLYSPYFP